uniref:SHSP domain-containing protein n=1 Tax=Romanomermis culicivorax TaxID=13658 RepID=A0A915JG03_ROMCU
MCAARDIEVRAAQTWDWPLQSNDGVVHVCDTPEKFEVGLEVHYFSPKEVEVKLTGDELVVHCRHDERSDQHGRVSREVFRSYKIPRTVDHNSLKSYLKPNGILMISADKKK